MNLMVWFPRILVYPFIPANRRPTGWFHLVSLHTCVSFESLSYVGQHASPLDMFMYPFVPLQVWASLVAVAIAAGLALSILVKAREVTLHKEGSKGTFAYCRATFGIFVYQSKSRAP